MRNALAGIALIALTMTAFAAHHEAAEIDEAEMMAVMMAAAKINEPHKQFAEAVGTWDAVMTFYMGPDAEPLETTMVVERSVELGGRVMVDHWRGNMMGAPFEGISRTGYDNVEQQYWSTWTDNMSTSVLMMYGKFDAETDALVMTGKAINPMTNNPYINRSVGKSVSPGVEEMQMYEDHGDGEYLSMSFTITKRAP
ncbi:MAG: DUF1579 family protein [Pseudomonadota bacterium]